MWSRPNFLIKRKDCPLGGSENRIRVRLDRQSNELEFVDAPQHLLMVTLQIFQAPRQYDVTEIGTSDKLLCRG